MNAHNLKDTIRIGLRYYNLVDIWNHAIAIQEGPPIGGGSAKRDITHPTAVPLRRVRFLAKGMNTRRLLAFR